jgi:hypothetical protein
MKRVATLLVGMALVLSVPASSALAASSTCQAYSSQTCTTPTTPTTTTGIPTNTTLPFTGMDIVLLLAGAGILICTGLAVRRLSRSQE